MTEEQRLRKRRWLQYSVRAVLVLVTVVSLSLGWLVHRARQQAAAVEAVLRSGGDVQYEWYFDAGARSRKPESQIRAFLGAVFGDDFVRRVTYIALGEGELHDADLERLDGLRHLEGITADNSRITDDALGFLARHAAIEVVSLRRTRVGDETLAALRRCKEIRELYIPETAVTDLGLAILDGHVNLDVVNFAGTEITDAGLTNLKAARNLRVLDLSNTKVTDAGLTQLRDFAGLMLLRLVGTNVTDEGVKNLQAALPKCTISL